MQFRKPLSTPESKRVFHCYSTHGKGYGHGPPIEGADIRILLVNASRDVLWADARFDGRNYHCEAARLDARWKRLGWVMVDGSLPLGELDAADPDLAQFDFLAAADTSTLPLHIHSGAFRYRSRARYLGGAICAFVIAWPGSRVDGSDVTMPATLT